jgi:HD-like signal output (HDOD) protein
MNLDRMIKNIEQIPPLPVISQKILNVIQDPNVSFPHLSRIIEKDQALALKILKIANSAFFNSLGKVSSLDHALVKLGMNEIKSIVLGFSVQNFFSTSEDSTFERARFWKHGIVCSQIAKYLGSLYHVRQDDSLFLSGLIHDMGKVVLDQYFHEDFLQIIDYINANETSFSKAEKQVTGTTHYQIAAKLLKQWKFPNQIVLQVFYHHAPWYDKDFQTHSIIIYLSNIFTKLAGFACHPLEKSLDIQSVADSAEIKFVVKSGFDLDADTLSKMLIHIQEFIAEDNNDVMSLFE